jgi:hypothetical protein
MKYLDAIAGVSFGIFVLIIALQGKATDAYILAKRDWDFVLWAGAIALLAASRQYVGKLADSLILAAFAGFFLLNMPKISQSFRSLQSSKI